MGGNSESKKRIEKSSVAAGSVLIAEERENSKNKFVFKCMPHACLRLCPARATNVPNKVHTFVR